MDLDIEYIIKHERLLKKRELAAKFMQGMLAHPTRYRPRSCDIDLHWHEAISKEALEMAEAFLKIENELNYKAGD